ncbi:MAG: phosphatidate cytidylyltransferase [Planctomycetes bacterium]|nr:phosphatidate cytidylyltransferase [Planctomycetota bacterium]
MSPYERLFSPAHAFEHPVTVWLTVALGVALTVSPLVLLTLGRRIAETRRQRLWSRWRSWLVLTLLLVGPILLGAAWTIVAICVLSLLCYREYARATGLFREKAISLTIVVGILLITFATMDNWYRLFMALTPLTITLILTVALFADRPQGYIQRTALGVLGFVLFGHGLGHLGHLANDVNFRPLILMVLVAAEMNVVFSYFVGRTLGHVPLCPNTSPKVTVAGVLGGLVLTTMLVMLLGTSVFRGTELANWHHLIVLGILISVVGQLGALIFASIKRDLGIKDFDVTIPGHGGLLDRFDRIVPMAAVVFHYVNYFVGVGAGQQVRIWTTFG